MTKKQQVEFFLKQNFLVTYLWIEKSSIKTATVTLLNDKPWNYNMNYYGIILVYIIVPWINAVSQIVPLIRKKNPLWVPDLYIRLLNVHYILYTNIICRVDANFNSDWLWKLWKKTFNSEMFWTKLFFYFMIPTPTLENHKTVSKVKFHQTGFQRSSSKVHDVTNTFLCIKKWWLILGSGTCKKFVILS